jgi:hypothetical protein
MNNKLTNRFDMIESVDAYLSLYPEKVAESAGLETALTKLKQLVADIRAKDNVKNGATKGKLDKKKNTIKELTNQLIKVSTALFLWAKNNNDLQIKALAKITRSEFSQYRDTQKINIAAAIYEAASGKDLAFAKVTPEDITGLNELAGELKKDIANLSSGASVRAAAILSLEEMVSEGLRILREDLDNYMEQFSADDPAFYNGYKSARVIWDTRATRKTEEPAEAPPV